MGEDFGDWKKHFMDQARGLVPYQRHFYKVSEQRGRGGGSPTIKMVSPSQQVVERAKTTLAQPPTVYDPVTGLVHRPENINKEIGTRKRKKVSKKSTIKTKKRKKQRKQKSQVSKKLRKKVKKRGRKGKKVSGKKKVSSKKKEDRRYKWW